MYALRQFAIRVHEGRLVLHPEHKLRSLIDVVREVGARTVPGVDDPLRKSFLKLVTDHATELCTNHDFIRDLGKSGLSEIAADMLLAVSQQVLRDRHFYVSLKIDLTALQSEMKEKEEFWEYCAPGWRY
jgi:hypothetical protein